ncbi:DUF3362 domain-containing protein, partial [Salmonella enterica subsp. enterica serovar Montevideo]|nr:DUF3362 domain-containing protein [Salmonella enterica subsp. enterica serovar Montevideo]
VVPKGDRQRRLHKALLRYHDPANWPLIRQALEAMGKKHLIGGMDMTPKREQQVSFSQPYYEGLSAVVVTRKGAYHTFADLKGK